MPSSLSEEQEEVRKGGGGAEGRKGSVRKALSRFDEISLQSDAGPGDPSPAFRQGKLLSALRGGGQRGVECSIQRRIHIMSA